MSLAFKALETFEIPLGEIKEGRQYTTDDVHVSYEELLQWKLEGKVKLLVEKTVLHPTKASHAPKARM